MLVRFAAERQAEQAGPAHARVAGRVPRIAAQAAAPQLQPPRSASWLAFLDWAVAQERIEASPLRAATTRRPSARVPFLFDPPRRAGCWTPPPPCRTTPGRHSEARPIARSSPSATAWGCGPARRAGCGGRRRRRAGAARCAWAASSARAAWSRTGRASASWWPTRSSAAAPDGADDPLFSFDGGRSVHPVHGQPGLPPSGHDLELSVPDGVSPPRLHNLRHSFAVGCLLALVSGGARPGSRLHQLSTFMGHVDPASTAVYLTITPALLDEANRRFEAFAAPAWSEGGTMSAPTPPLGPIIALVLRRPPGHGEGAAASIGAQLPRHRPAACWSSSLPTKGGKITRLGLEDLNFERSSASSAISRETAATTSAPATNASPPCTRSSTTSPPGSPRCSASASGSRPSR